ncbi:hypothetical protein L596_019758 [Steinernema carpocapsae]|uniref:G-protein coupled receptors family 1 profile domain-containing protein n=1 Tax=Steinernema carpocapsae TaxID=34508 RepID=A0A4V6A0P8_STECR|nr:hypothetical protein L596_019758 [Steinernema carpocapsae]
MAECCSTAIGLLSLSVFSRFPSRRCGREFLILAVLRMTCLVFPLCNSYAPSSACSMVDWYQNLYNRALDVTAIIHIPLKLFTIGIVFFKTPAEFRHNSYFTLNVLFWNFGANLFFSFVHLYPVYPLACFRLDGPLSCFVENETVGHVVFILIFVCVVNAATALVITFPYRYYMVKNSQSAGQVDQDKLFKICLVLHVLATVFWIAASANWPISYVAYPGGTGLASSAYIFCFNPDGWHKLLPVLGFYAYIVLAISIVIVFAVLLFVKLYVKTDITNEKTLKLQRQLLWKLVIQTAIILILGGIPMIFAVFSVTFPDFPYAKQICLISIVFMCNHGTLYSIAALTMMKSYRAALLQIVCRRSNVVIVKSQATFVTKSVR